MNIKIINVGAMFNRDSLKDKNLIVLFDKLESDPDECSKESALILVKSLGDDYKTQIENLYKTDLTFAYITKDTKNNCLYVNTEMDNFIIDLDNIINNDGDAFKDLGHILNGIEYGHSSLAIYAII